MGSSFGACPRAPVLTDERRGNVYSVAISVDVFAGAGNSWSGHYCLRMVTRRQHALALGRSSRSSEKFRREMAWSNMGTYKVNPFAEPLVSREVTVGGQVQWQREPNTHESLRPIR